MKKIKLRICLCALLAFLFLLAGCKKTDSNIENDSISDAPVPATAEPENRSFDVSVREFNKHGNVILDTTIESLQDRNIEPGDIITLTIDGQEYETPVGTSYSDVDSGCMICRFDIEDAKVTLAVNGGSFAETTGMAEKETITEDPGYMWHVNTDSVSICLTGKKGYLDEYSLRNLERTNERSDYADLSDDDYANCRAVSTAGIRPSTVFRGTTPLDPGMGRNEYAMSFIESNKIRAILNLCDTEEEMKAFDTYAGSCYSGCKIYNSVMDYKFASDEFASKVKDCVLFINENDGPFYIHCKEGKDRTGILCAVLECYFGASYDEITEDYIKTYENFYHIEAGSDIYDLIIRTNFEKVLSEMFDVNDLSGSDLKKEAEEYLLSCGLTESDLASLAARIGA